MKHILKAVPCGYACRRGSRGYWRRRARTARRFEAAGRGRQGTVRQSQEGLHCQDGDSWEGV